MATTTTGNNKVLIWALGALSTLCSYIAVIQRNRIEDMKETMTQNNIKYNSERIDKLKIQREKDSLQALILSRTDNSVTFSQLKQLMEIKSNKSTITITPKK